MAVEMGVEATSQSVETLFHMIEPGIDPVETCVQPSEQRIEPRIRPCGE